MTKRVYEMDEAELAAHKAKVAEARRERERLRDAAHLEYLAKRAGYKPSPELDAWLERHARALLDTPAPPEVDSSSS